ncbi:SUF system Fe-S cluster assembly protein [Bacteroidales bacterium]
MNVKTNHPEQCQLAVAGLKTVFDPEIDLNVVDLGLIYEIHFFDEPKKVNCLMTLSTQFCPMGESIVDSVKYSLESNFPDRVVEVTLTFDPPWTADCISEEGRAYLNS